MMRRLTAVLALTLAACGGGQALPPDSVAPVTAPPTVAGVGDLPDAIATPAVVADLADVADDAPTPPVSVAVTRPVDENGVVLETVSELVNGNRVIAIGDSILASTATRYGGEMCEALTELGWSVEVDAEPGRFVPFGNEVLGERLPADVSDEEDFDAAIVHLGSNYAEDRDDYFEQLNDILFRIAPRPTLLLTVTEYRPAWVEVNDVIRDLAALYDNVIVVDWGQIARAPGVLSRDGLHPSAQGEAVLVEQLAVALGRAGATPGECLTSDFTDDSAVRSGSSGGSTSGASTSGASTSGSSSSSGSTSGSSSSGSSSSTSSSSSSGGSSSGGSTSGSSSSGGGSSSGGSSSTGGTTTGTTTDGDTTTGDTTDGTTTGDTTGGSTTDGATTDGDATGGGTTTDGSTTDGSTTGGSTTAGGGTTGDTSGGQTTTGATTDGSTTGGSTTAGGGGTTGGTTGGETTTGGATTGGAATGGDATAGGAATGGEATTGG